MGRCVIRPKPDVVPSLNVIRRPERTKDGSYVLVVGFPDPRQLLMPILREACFPKPEEENERDDSDATLHRSTPSCGSERSARTSGIGGGRRRRSSKGGCCRGGGATEFGALLRGDTLELNIQSAPTAPKGQPI